MSSCFRVNMLRKITFLLVVAATAYSGYPDEPTSNRIDGSDSYGYGYSGSFSGGVPPNFPIPNFDFSGLFNGYLAELSKYHAELMRNIQAQAAQAAGAGGAATGAGAGGYGGSYDGGYGGSFSGSAPVGGGHAFSGGMPVGGGFGGGFGGGYGGSGPVGGGFSYSGGAPGAVASASIGPGGGQQTAAVYPENPGVPNINSRFGGSGQPGGFKSVSTFSSSHTTNVNGVPRTVQQATSTINDNGRVTTYTAKNP
ncbi:unnamed protein product [Acanthoscelides obtectus]|uniref:Uncharacterized protein n=1 Tax=Acanthoscelides obtectus TaxID=200917 RepID=A0A9P0MI68_ACAOB|nr:unnamed protein product [Acanthoscelides obtectus]CAK1650806.1 hypothetical protein AOBTE_LOCUS16906 [Acanthoscelides obtectus]